MGRWILRPDLLKNNSSLEPLIFMWIFLGIVSFTIFFGYNLWRRLRWALGWTKDKGYLHTIGRQAYKSMDSTNKGVRTFHFAVPCPPDVSLRIHRESSWDRFAKKIGLSYEYQFNDPQFDDELYVVSNAPALQTELTESQALRDTIRLLFGEKRLKRIECHGQHVVAHYQEKVEKGTVITPNPVQIQIIVTSLYELAKSLATAKSKCQSRWDVFQLRAALLAALATALLMLGTVEFFRVFLFERTQVMLDAEKLFSFSILCAGLLLFALVTATATLLRGSSYAHVILAEVLVSGGVGLALGSYVMVRDINISFDQSAQRMIQANIVGKNTWRGRKSGTHYELRLSGQDGSHQLPRKIEVSYNLYNQAQEGESLTMTIRDGALGYRWIEEYTPMKSTLSTINPTSNHSTDEGRSALSAERNIPQFACSDTTATIPLNNSVIDIFSMSHAEKMPIKTSTSIFCRQ